MTQSSPAKSSDSGGLIEQVCGEVRLEPVSSGRLVVRFIQRSDRIGHAFIWEGDQQSCTLLESIEVEGQSTEAANWPPSPVIQQCHGQSPIDQSVRGDMAAPASEVIFGVGMAGQSYWSLTAERSPLPAGLVIDVACRIRQAPARLGSSYHVPFGKLRALNGDLELGLSHGGLRLELLSGPVRWSIEDCQHFQVLPLLDENSTYPHTVRWRYRLRMANDAGAPLP